MNFLLKYLLVSIIAILLVYVVSFSACKKDDDAASDGKKFANAVCDCYKNYGGIDLTSGDNDIQSLLSPCLQELFKRYWMLRVGANSGVCPVIHYINAKLNLITDEIIIEGQGTTTHCLGDI